jgi:hypothetical protein
MKIRGKREEEEEEVEEKEGQDLSRPAINLAPNSRLACYAAFLLTDY